MKGQREKPTVSVIMNCHDGAEYLEEAINSVYEQEYSSWEIVFLDNASTDNSSEIVRQYDQKLKYFFNPKKLPLGRARNLAIKNATGKYLAFLDCDDLWLPQKIAKQIETLESKLPNEKYAFCYTDAARIDSNGKDIIPFFLEKSPRQGDCFLYLIAECFIPLSSCLVNRKIFYEVGSIDHNLNQVEEWDLWLRLSQDYKLAFVPEILTKIRSHASNLSSNYKEQYDETKTVLSRLKIDASLEQYRKNALIWFDIRYHVINFVHKIKSDYLTGIQTFFLLIFKCLRHPFITCKLISKYFSIDFIRFFYTKYYYR